MKEISGTWSDEEIEQRIQYKGLAAPRVTGHDIEDAISEHAAIQYHRFPGTTVTICCVPMKNGFNVVGESAAVSMENFDEEIGREVALKNAKDKMWALLGYALRERLAVKRNEII